MSAHQGMGIPVYFIYIYLAINTWYLMDDQNMCIAYFLVRVIAGILFFFQGYDKLFILKMEEVINTFMADAERRHIPRAAVAFLSYVTSMVEFLGGLMLIAGLYTNYATWLLAFDLVLISMAFSMMQPMWDLRHVFPRLLLLVILLLLPVRANCFSLDRLFNF